LWNFTYRKQSNPQNSGSAGDNLIEMPIGKEHAERDFAP